MSQQRSLLLTKQRKAVLDMITEADDHPTAAEIIERLNNRGYHFAYGTVYNSLRYLTEAGLVQELHVGDGACHYDRRTDDHCHIVCRQCHAIAEFDLPESAELVQHAGRRSDYEVQAMTLLFEGLCPACAHTA
ncbi:MAG: transcriptional repressor [Firmicutes bacterium]|nr:transcriptional repressor [Bacillota bacterium]